MISCVILTKNEEQDILRCLNSLSWCDDIHLLDSGSTDATARLAETSGATVTVNVPEGPFRHANQRNWALANLPLVHDWILFVDADEVATHEFATELSHRLGREMQFNSYYCAPKFIYHGRWLRHTKSFPTWEPRVVQKGSVAFTPGGWERFDDRAVPGFIKAPYEHYPNSKGIVSWMQKHAHYATWESGQDTKQVSSRARKIAAKFGGFRPGLVLMWFLFVRRAFLDGREGLSYVRRMFIYELIVREAIVEERTKTAGRPL